MTIDAAELKIMNKGHFSDHAQKKPKRRKKYGMIK